MQDQSSAHLQPWAVAHVQGCKSADHVADGVHILWVVAIYITQTQLT